MSKYVFTVGQRNDLAKQTAGDALNLGVQADFAGLDFCLRGNQSPHHFRQVFILLVAQSVSLEPPPHSFLEIKYTWIHLMHIHG